MSKDKSYREAAQYYHAPFALLRKPRVQVLKQRMGIVQLQTGLLAAELKPNSTVPPKDKPGMIRVRIRQGYDDNLFPVECKEMDESALDKSVQEIRNQNAEELNLLNL